MSKNIEDILVILNIKNVNFKHLKERLVFKIFFLVNSVQNIFSLGIFSQNFLKTIF